MFNRQRPFAAITRVALFAIIGITSITLAAAGASAAGFSFVGPVIAFLGLQPPTDSPGNIKPAEIDNDLMLSPQAAHGSTTRVHRSFWAKPSLRLDHPAQRSINLTFRLA